MSKTNKITQCLKSLSLKALSENLEKEEFKKLVNVEYEKGALLNPRCDPTFKTLFTHNSEESNYALKCFLSAVLDRKIAEVTLQPTELPKESEKDKNPFFDVSCRFTDSEEYFDVELQGRNNYDSYDKRAEYYAAHLLNHYTHEGTSWINVPKVYQVSVLNFNLSRSNEDIVDWYLMKNRSNDTLAERLNIIFVYLKKLFRQNEDIEMLELKSLTSVEKWCIFFLCADNKEYGALVDELAQSEEGIMEAQCVLSKISDDELNWSRQRAYYETLSHEETIRDEADTKGYQRGYESGKKDGYDSGMKEGYDSGKKEGYDSGMSKGLEQGAHDKAVENAKNFLKMNVNSIEQIAQGVGLSVEEVKALDNEINAKK